MQRVMIILHLTRIIRVCANYISPLCCDWWNSVGKMQEIAQGLVVDIWTFFHIYVYERMIFMKAMPDNDVSSFFLSPSACDLILLWIHYVYRWCVSSVPCERRKFLWFAEIISQHIFCSSSPYNIIFSFTIYFLPASI